ncbi:acyl carrier protein [Actinocrispum wychmicini]|uniref:Acyl carrier protein n=1 Tax=Actinocrispum wychmicini TaxID=1213861 RepID=A0A4V2S3K3_9PSEU|nr:acyl carrier protein [Actinocrispum wychmicini]TCO44750.1 acyl carrier protein [Actinocrispum wychmicini]
MNDRAELLDKLAKYVELELLDGKDITDFTTTTPLLEWGLLNSIETARLVAYIREEFGIRVPPTEMVSRNFQDIERIADLVSELRAPAALPK